MYIYMYKYTVIGAPVARDWGWAEATPAATPTGGVGCRPPPRRHLLKKGHWLVRKSIASLESSG